MTLKRMINADIRITGVIAASVITGLMGKNGLAQTRGPENKRPNILFAISDDQSYPYASAYGTKGLNTPAFDMVSKAGILFSNAFVAAPQSSPCRAAILTGRNIWQLEEAGTHSSLFPKKFVVFTDLLAGAGYKVGYTGKAWSPGNWMDAGWDKNPVGEAYNKKSLKSVPTSGISKNDYSANFEDFYSQKSDDQPFFFWYGGTEPHRSYEAGSGLRSGKKLSDALVPPFLPSDSVVKSDILDYYLEIEYFDLHLRKIIEFLKEKGELENTLIVVTSDNGMSFPAAKANLMEYGIHVPLAVCWPQKIRNDRSSDDLVSLIDLAPTFLDIAGIKNPQEMAGKSLTRIFFSDKNGNSDPSRKYILAGRERHSHARADNLGYPARAIRTQEYLYILNIKPDRWPAGDPVPNGSSLWPGYHDIDNGPTKLLIVEEPEKWTIPFRLGYEKRPEEQLYDIKNDKGCINNLAGDPGYLNIKNELRKKLIAELTKQNDPRITGGGDVFDSYPRFGEMRDFDGFKEAGKYNPAFIKK
jgi:uncharacterized sulfatase